MKLLFVFVSAVVSTGLAELSNQKNGKIVDYELVGDYECMGPSTVCVDGRQQANKGDLVVRITTWSKANAAEASDEACADLCTADDRCQAYHYWERSCSMYSKPPSGACQWRAQGGKCYRKQLVEPPTSVATTSPSVSPTSSPSALPTIAPTPNPTASPTPNPTAQPTVGARGTAILTAVPTVSPTAGNYTPSAKTRSTQPEDSKPDSSDGSNVVTVVLIVVSLIFVLILLSVVLAMWCSREGSRKTDRLLATTSEEAGGQVELDVEEGDGQVDPTPRGAYDPTPRGAYDPTPRATPKVLIL